MTSVQSNVEAKKMLSFYSGATLILLAAHFYYVCFKIIPFDDTPANTIIPIGKLIKNVGHVFYRICERIPFIADETLVKLAVIMLVIPPLLAARPNETRQRYKWPLIFLATGAILFFGSAYLLPVGTDKTVAISYMIITVIGYLSLDGGATRLIRARKYVFHQNKFRKDTAGFIQEERLITTEYSLNFPATYQLNGRIRKSYINIINPRRGVLIMGSPGSGKSWFIIEPAIDRLLQQGRALFVYDHKFPALTDFTYSHWLLYSNQYPASTRFYCVNFSDLSRSNRCNLIDPATLHYNRDASGISQAILFSMNKSWINKQGDFFQESSIAFLASLIWFLKGYKGGMYCTLPHVIELSKTRYEELFTILYAEPSTSGMIGTFVESYMNKTMEMVDGQITSARIPLTKLDSPDFYYVLSGNDPCLDINHQEAPAVVCLGGDPVRCEALAPILSLFVDRLNRLVNQPDRYPTALIMDEFATVRATSVQTTIATGRSNNIIPILALQDLSQLTQLYSHAEAMQIMNTSGNLICGQVAGETADWVSKRFHTSVHLRTTISVNSNDVSTSKTEQPTEEISSATLANLSSGEFVGIVADDPDTKLELKGFHASFTRNTAGNASPAHIPVIADVTAATIAENYQRIRKEVTALVKEELKRIVSDPVFKQFIVKR